MEEEDILSTLQPKLRQDLKRWSHPSLQMEIGTIHSTWSLKEPPSPTNVPEKMWVLGGRQLSDIFSDSVAHSMPTPREQRVQTEDSPEAESSSEDMFTEMLLASRLISNTESLISPFTTSQGKQAGHGGQSTSLQGEQQAGPQDKLSNTLNSESCPDPQSQL